MAEEDLGQTKSEEPTQRRREEAREQGQVAFSTDLTTGLLLLATLAALASFVPMIASGLAETLRNGMAHCAVDDLPPQQVQGMLYRLFGKGLELLGFFFCVVVLAGILVPMMQVGFYIAPGLLGMNLEKLSPSRGWGRLLSFEGGVRGLIAVAKVIFIVMVAYWVLRWRAPNVAMLGTMRLAPALSTAWSAIVHLAIAVAGTLVVLGVFDYFFQRYKHDQSLRMTREELKQEVKNDEGDPQVKARIRRLQREAGQKRMMQDVPKATVVVTNPTHLAVALRYDSTMSSPQVVAKGAGAVAHRIADIARRHGVSVVERKPLAQALFKTVKVGQQIPAALYIAVAELLAYVFRLKGQGMAATK